MTHNRSKQQLEDDSTSVAPPQCLHSQTVSKPQPLSGSSRQRVELQTAVTADESESIDKDETDKNDKNYSRKGEEDSIIDDDSVQGDKKNSEYVFPVSFPFSRGFFFFFYFKSFVFMATFPLKDTYYCDDMYPSKRGVFLILAGPPLLR